MNVSCFADVATQNCLDRANKHHVAADVSVVIPAKQEAASLGDVINRTRRYANEIVVVVGRSTDGTDTVATENGASVLTDGARGKGEALRCAIPHIRTPVTVFLDADGSHDPEDIPLLVEPILAGEADHVAASRLRGGSSELHGGFDEFLRLAGSSFITACINWRFKCQLSDSQNGFRAVRTSVLQQLNLRENTTTIEQEMTILTLKHGWRMAEVPSHEHRRLHGASHIRVWRDAPRYAYSLVKLLFFS
jgi:glycosyltransferase involved in cell wall biosynthesis